jgi:hypothetical protein
LRDELFERRRRVSLQLFAIDRNQSRGGWLTLLRQRRPLRSLAQRRPGKGRVELVPDIWQRAAQRRRHEIRGAGRRAVVYWELRGRLDRSHVTHLRPSLHERLCSRVFGGLVVREPTSPLCWPTCLLREVLFAALPGFEAITTSDQLGVTLASVRAAFAFAAADVKRHLEGGPTADSS